MLRLEYLEAVNLDDLQPVRRVTGSVLVTGANWRIHAADRQPALSSSRRGRVTV